jgi:hypothetical protein
MALPSDWKAGGCATTSPATAYREFNPSADKDVKVSFFYRGTPVDNARHRLPQPSRLSPHALSAAGCIRSDRCCGAKTTPTVRRPRLWTTDVAGKRVLMLEGRYLENNVDMQACSSTPTTQGSGSGDQYQARDKYQQHLASMKGIRSIRWK